jgi:hypothetical protein
MLHARSALAGNVFTYWLASCFTPHYCFRNEGTDPYSIDVIFVGGPSMAILEDTAMKRHGCECFGRNEYDTVSYNYAYDYFVLVQTN